MKGLRLADLIRAKNVKRETEREREREEEIENSNPKAHKSVL